MVDKTMSRTEAQKIVLRCWRSGAREVSTDVSRALGVLGMSTFDFIALNGVVKKETRRRSPIVDLAPPATLAYLADKRVRA